jgi:hypothetical protein
MRKSIFIAAALTALCFTPASAQQTQEPGKLIINEVSGKCLDVPGISNTTPGTPLQLYDCETSGLEVGGKKSDQFWLVSQKGQIRNTLSGLCIDIAGTDNNSLLQIKPCDPANPAQVWMFHPNGFIQNEVTGKCINVAGVGANANMTPLQLSDCEFGDPQTDQRWNS